MYGTHTELEERGVNTSQLLGLIKTEDEEDKEYEYDEEESETENIENRQKKDCKTTLVCLM